MNLENLNPITLNAQVIFDQENLTPDQEEALENAPDEYVWFSEDKKEFYNYASGRYFVIVELATEEGMNAKISDL